MDDTQLYDAQVAASYDMFVWGWTPFVDPDPMLSYFTCAQVDDRSRRHRGPTTPTGASEEYDELYEQQKVELDPDRRREIVAEMLRLFNREATYLVLLPGRRPAGLPHRPLRGLAAAAGRDRPGAVHQHVADVRNLTVIDDGSGDDDG